MKPESVWDCKVCIDQMFGGPRCIEHNPSPEERDARNVWKPVLDRVHEIDPASVSAAEAAWLIEEVGVRVGEPEYAAQLADKLREEPYAF